MSGSGERARLERIFRAGVAAAHPDATLRAMLTRDARGLCIAEERIDDAARLHLLGVGKAAAGMAATACACLGPRIARALVVTKDGHGRPGLQGRVLEAGHPVPDARSAAAGREALAFVAAVPPADLLLVLLSGGASSLLSCPAQGLEAEDLAQTTRLLLASGAAIDELNAVRKHLSATAGGRLALATRARVVVLAVSDVPHDRIDLIGSGPFAADPTGFDDAIAVLRERGVWSQAPPAVRRVLESGARGERPDTPGEGAAELARVRHHVLTSNRTALAAARRAASQEGVPPVAVWEELAGEARDVGRRLGGLLAALRPGRPVCLLAGGETTVTLRGAGRGGRSQELALAAALEIQGCAGVGLLAAGTDGSDGPTDAAGAFVDGGSVARGRACGEAAEARLRDNDSHRFFSVEGGLLCTGPTGTNVRDLVIAIAGGGATGPRRSR